MGEQTTLTATVTPTDTAGTVTFTIDGQTYPATVTNGIATLEHTFLAAGDHVVVADFTPTNTDRYLPSSDQATINVEAETTHTALTLDRVEVTAGSTIQATATVTPADAAGDVEFTAGETVVSVPVGTDSTATAELAANTAGNVAVTATFIPADPDRYNTSTDTRTVDVRAAVTAEPTSIDLDAGTADAGEEITLTATVSPAEAEGEVRFTIDGVEHLVPVVDGVATLVHVAGERGSYTVRAEFVPTDPAAYGPSEKTATLTVLGDEQDPGTDPAEPTIGSLSLAGLIGSVGIGVALHSSGSLASLGS